jgi:hypothetical protein
MSDELRPHLESCMNDLRSGSLTVAKLQYAINLTTQTTTPRQDLLYLQCSSASVGSGVIGISIIQDGEIVPVDSDPANWPYQSVLDALRDGWRVISFPNTALLPLDDATYGLGCEFILERFGNG